MKRARKNAPAGSEIICKLCGRSFEIIAGSHLSVHGTTREEYMEEFGLSPDQLATKEFRTLMSTRSDYTPLSNKQIQQQIRSIFGAHERPGSELVRKRWPQVYEQGINIFGSWEKAVRSVGAASWRMERSEEWTPARVIKEMRTHYRRNGHLRRLRRLQSEYDVLPWYAVRHFGGWRAAIMAAGIDPKCAGIRQIWSRERVLKMASGQKRSSMSDREFERFSNACRNYFGSVEKALKASGRSWEEFFGINRWSKELVHRKLREHRKNRGSHCGPWVRSNDNVVYQMAVKYYASWEQALEAAGIAPARRIWSRARLAKEVFRLLDGGRKPTNAYFVQKHDKGLYSRCREHFGSWEKAVKAAGLEFQPAQRLKWTREVVLASIRKLDAEGKLGEGARVSLDHQPLYQAGCKQFGSWQAALGAAGVEQASFRPR